jgi:hypothetical protein
MYTLRNFWTSFIAVAAILAMLVVPACGSLCAAMTHCSTSTVSAGSENCHHLDMSAQSDSEASSFSSQVSCGQQTPLVAVLTSFESSLQIESGSAANTALSIDVPAHAASLNHHALDFSLQKPSPQQAIPLENLSVLRV